MLTRFAFRVSKLALVAVLTVGAIPGCGGGGGDGGDGPSAVGPPAVTPVIDVALRGTDGSLPRIHIYRDVLHGPTSGAEPDARIPSPPSIRHMAFNGSHLVLAADYGNPGGNSILVYPPANLAQAVPLPGATVVLPSVVGATYAQIKALVVHDTDVYVLCSFSDQASPATLTVVTYVYRDVDSLTNASTADATITHNQIQVSGLFTSQDHLSVVGGLLWATVFGKLCRNLAPESLVGSVVPDRTLDLQADLGLDGREQAVVARGDIYLINREITAYADAADLAAGQQPLFRLAGPSGSLAVVDGFLRLRGRLFSLGYFPITPFAIVGHDVAGPVAEYAPPDVMLGPPVVGQQKLDGAADTLCAASTDLGIVAVYPNASSLPDEAKPTLYLWDPDISQAVELRVSER